MEYIGLIVIVIIITMLWFVNYQNYCQNQKIERLNEQVNELIYVVEKKSFKYLPAMRNNISR